MNKTPDYQSLIDQEVWDFIEHADRFYPADAVQKSIDEQRAIYTAMCREFSNGHPNGVVASDEVVETREHKVPVRRYVHSNNNDDSYIIYMHGGGFVVGDLDSHDDVCAELCATTGLGVTSIDYRLSPEHKHPAAFNDSLAVVQFEAQRLGVPLLLCGDSAGGNLCAAVSHRLRSTEKPSPVFAQVLIYPALGGDPDTGSYLVHANAPQFTRDDVLFYLRVRVDGSPPTNDVSYAPLHDDNFANLPKTFAVSAECDPVADDGRLYCEAIRKAGGNATWRNEAGLVHGYLRARHTSSRAKASFKAITDQLSEFARSCKAT